MNLTRKPAAALFCVLLAAAAVVFGATGALAGDGDAGTYPKRLVDGSGRAVVVPRLPARIVSLAPSATEMLYAVGAGPQMVGATKWCDYPAEAAKLSRVGDMNIDLERVVALRPDLVVADAGLEPRVVATLERTGLTVLAVAPTNVAEVLESLQLVATATGHAATGRQVTSQLKARLDKLKAAGRAAAQARSAPLRVFALLDAAELYTAGPGTFIDELVRMAGGVNIAGDAKAAWPLFSEESLLMRDPQVIMVTYFPRDEVLRRPRWQGIQAVKSGRVYTIDPDIISRPGPRLVDGLEQLVRIFSGVTR